MQSSKLKKYREILERKRDELLATIPARTPATEPGSKSGDWIDQSSQENDVHVQLALKQTDTKLLRAIELLGTRVAPLVRTALASGTAEEFLSTNSHRAA